MSDGISLQMCSAVSPTSIGRVLELNRTYKSPPTHLNGRKPGEHVILQPLSATTQMAMQLPQGLCYQTSQLRRAHLLRGRHGGEVMAEGWEGVVDRGSILALLKL